MVQMLLNLGWGLVVCSEEELPTRTQDFLLKDWLDNMISALGLFRSEHALPFDTVLRSFHWVLDQIASVLRESTAGYLLRGLGFVSWDSFPIYISWEGETWWQEMWWMVICLESPG